MPVALAATLGQPLMSATLKLAGEELPITDIEDIPAAVHGLVSLIIDGGNCGIEPTSVVDLTGRFPVVLRSGKGPVEAFS